MQQVTVQRERLLAIVRENRINHERAYLKALEGYMEAVKDAFKVALEAVTDPAATLNSFEANVQAVSVLRMPSEHLGEYDQVLAMLELSVDDTITLQSHEFSQLVRDEWNWKREFVRSTSLYAGR